MECIKLKVGMILDERDHRALTEEDHLEGSRRAIFEALLRSPFVSELTPVVTHQEPRKPSQNQAETNQVKSRIDETAHLLERAVKKACSVIETTLYGQAHTHHPIYDPELLRALRAQKLRGHLVLSQRRKKFWSETEVSPELKELGLDLLVRCSGLGIERGSLLTEGARLGVLSLHHGYNDLNRGGPVGYWEVHYGEPSGITAQLLSRELDGGTIISQHMIRSADAPHTNRARIYSHTGQVIEHALAKIAKNKPPIETDLYFREILKEPRATQRVKLNTRLVSAYTQQLHRRMIRKTVRGSRLHRDPLWKVYASTNPKKRFTRWTPVHGRGELARGDWVADPFAIKVAGRHYLICEHWVMGEAKGRIASCEITDLQQLTFEPLSPLIINEEHLSYPYTFERSNRAYVLPENQSNGLSLYELSVDENGLLKATLDRQLLSGYWVDPSVIRVDDADYLFVSEGKNPSVLRLFTSPDLTQSPLTEHPMSPVVIDARTGRNAGRVTLNEDGTITRPAQDCSAHYGSCIHLCRHRVTLTEFDDLGLVRTINAHAQVNNFHHVEYYRGITFHDCVEPS